MTTRRKAPKKTPAEQVAEKAALQQMTFTEEEVADHAGFFNLVAKSARFDGLSLEDISRIHHQSVKYHSLNKKMSDHIMELKAVIGGDKK